jgi:hypothetical protein
MDCCSLGEGNKQHCAVRLYATLVGWDCSLVRVGREDVTPAQGSLPLRHSTLHGFICTCYYPYLIKFPL